MLTSVALPRGWKYWGLAYKTRKMKRLSLKKNMFLNLFFMLGLEFHRKLTPFREKKTEESKTRPI